MATLVPPGAPAGAAPAGTVTANLFLRNFTLPAGGPAVEEELSFFLSSDRPGWADEVTISVDTASVAAVADVEVEPAQPEVTCRTTGPVTRCTVPGPQQVLKLPETGSFSLFTIPSVTMRLTAKPGSVPGDAGTLTVTAKADDGPATTENARVRIGAGVNLTAIDPRPRTVAPGGSVALRPQVRNTGSRDVEGLVLTLAGAALADTDFGNCAYEDDGGAVCTFDATLAAGRTYQTSQPFTVRIPSDAAAGSEARTDAQWLTLAEWQDWEDSLGGPSTGRQGAGPDLDLIEVPSARAAQVPQADTDADDNGSSSTVTVTGRRRADVVAVGAMVTGRPGEARRIEVGLVNRGPGTLRYPPFGNNLPFVFVTMPPGLSVLRADARCSALFAEDPPGPPPSAAAGGSGSGPLEYACTPQSLRLRPGQRLTFAFTVQPGRAAADAEGAVEVLMDDVAAIDRKPANNRAAIALRLGGQGGGLPVTGTTAATIAAEGLGLLLTGATVLAALRRRRRP
ncbi:hypothetical protein ACPCHT_37965 [Nucisporomicrobium flavum]|uniref:hypothetical protein n=1 Tax=Nucisporomicrobium flavum TaxID=2785915 RepID=UPI003C2CD806